jgi:hypothetical protein
MADPQQQCMTVRSVSDTSFGWTITGRVLISSFSAVSGSALCSFTASRRVWPSVT